MEGEKIDPRLRLQMSGGWSSFLFNPREVLWLQGIPDSSFPMGIEGVEPGVDWPMQLLQKGGATRVKKRKCGVPPCATGGEMCLRCINSCTLLVRATQDAFGNGARLRDQRGLSSCHKYLCIYYRPIPVLSKQPF